MDKELLEILVCPMGLAPVKPQGEFLVCSACGAQYPVRDDIPVMLIDEIILPTGVKKVEDLSCWKKLQERQQAYSK